MASSCRINSLNQIKKNVAANYLGQIWTAIMSIAFVPIYIDSLGIESYALVGFFSSLLVWFHLLDFGLAPTLNREFAKFSVNKCNSKSISCLLRSFEILSMMVAMFVFLVFLCLSDWIANSWLKSNSIPKDELVVCIIIMGFVASLRFVESIYKSSMLGLQTHVHLNITIILMVSLRGIGSIFILAYVSNTITAFFVWQGFVSLLTISTLCFQIYRLVPFDFFSGRFSLDELKRVLSFATGVFFLTLLTVFVSQFDKLILSGSVGLADYGYYMVASMLAGTLHMTAMPILQSFYPQLCASLESQNVNKFNDLYMKGTKLVTLVSGSAALIMMFFSTELIYLWSKDDSLAQSAGSFVKIIALGNLFSILNLMPHHAQLASGWTSLPLKLNLYGSVFLIPAALFFIPQYGNIAAASIWLSFTFLYYPLSILFTCKKLILNYSFIRNLAMVTMPLIIGCFCVLIVKNVSPFANTPLGTFMTIIVAGVACLVSMAICFEDGRKYFMFWSRRILGVLV